VKMFHRDYWNIWCWNCQRNKAIFIICFVSSYHKRPPGSVFDWSSSQ
jgi:hypothetical protein